MATHVRATRAKRQYPRCRQWIMDQRLAPLLYRYRHSSWYWDGLRARSCLEDAQEWVDMTIAMRFEMRRMMAEGFYGNEAQNAIINYSRVWEIRDQLGRDSNALEWTPLWPV